MCALANFSVPSSKSTVIINVKWILPELCAFWWTYFAHRLRKSTNLVESASNSWILMKPFGGEKTIHTSFITPSPPNNATSFAAFYVSMSMINLLNLFVISGHLNRQRGINLSTAFYLSPASIEKTLSCRFTNWRGVSNNRNTCQLRRENTLPAWFT